MKKKLTNLLLILTSAFIFTSCGEPDMAEKSIQLMEEGIAAADANDTEKFNAAAKKFADYALELAADPEAMAEAEKNATEESTEKLMAVSKRYAEAAEKMAKKNMPTAPVTQ